MLALGVTMVAAVIVLCAFRCAVTAPGRPLARRRDMVRPISVRDRDGYAREWWRIQAEFLDAPWVAVVEADALVTRVLDARGVPVPTQVTRARRLLRGASTEELRQGLIRYRRLVAELLEQPVEEQPNPN